MATDGGPLPVGKLSRQGLDVDAADAIRKLINSGEVNDGFHLREESVAARLGVSRGTIRAAFKQLAHEGLVESRPGRGVYVRAFSSSDAWEIYTLRNALEGLAARLAAQRIDEQGGAHIAQVIGDMRSAAARGDRSGVAKAERAFHQLVIELAGHSRLRSAYEILDLQTQRFIARTMTDEFHPNLVEVADAHEELARAIAGGDAQAAESLASAHNTRDGELLAASLSKK